MSIHNPKQRNGAPIGIEKKDVEINIKGDIITNAAHFDLSVHTRESLALSSKGGASKGFS